MKHRVGLLVLLHCLAWSGLYAAPITWTNVSGGLWSDNRNWSPNHVPGSADVAIIEEGGTYIVQLNVSTTVGGFRLGGPHGIQGIVTDPFNLTALTNNGPGLIGTNGFITIFQLGTLAGSGPIMVDGAVNFFGGRGNGTGLLSIRPGGLLLLDGNVFFFGSRPVENAGKLQWLSGEISNLAALTNLASGEMEILVSASTLTAGAPLVNSGVIRKRSGSGSVLMTVPGCRNDGTLRVESGTLFLNVNGPVVHAGTISVSAGAGYTLHTASGTTSDFLAGSSLIGQGDFAFNEPGTKNFAGIFDVNGTISFGAGTVNIAPGVRLTNGTIAIQGSAFVNFNTGTVLSPSSLVMGGGTLAGNDSWLMNGPVNLNGGELRSPGTIECLGGLTITSVTISEGLLQNSANGVIAGNLGMAGVSTFRTSAGATTEFRNGTVSLVSSGGFAQRRFDNQGLLRVTGVASTAVFMTNNGVVEIEGGAFSITVGGSLAGAFRLTQGGRLSLSPQGLSFFDTASILGTGDVTFGDTSSFPPVNVRGSLAVTGKVTVAGNFRFIGDVSLDNSSFVVSSGTADFSTGRPLVAREFILSSGALAGTDPLTVNNHITWTAGTLGGQAPLVANEGITLNGQMLFLNGRRIYNMGAATWSAGTVFTGNGSVISNAAGATFDITFDARTYAWFPGTRSFINAGLLRKTGGTGMATITDSIQNLGTIEVRSGTLSIAAFVQTAGATLLQGGNIAAREVLDIQGGLLAGAGEISGSVRVAGQCAPGGSASSLRINGDYTQAGSGQLNIELGGTSAGTTYDQLSISGAANLAGTLNVSSLSGYQPPPGAFFRILIFASRSGDFSVFNDNTGGNLQRQYDATGLMLVAMAPALTIRREGEHLRLAWPESAAGYHLQCASNFPCTNWVTLSTETNSTLLVPTERHSFYRLIKP